MARSRPTQYGIAQRALVELAVGVAGHRVDEVDAARQLVAGEHALAVREQLVGELGRRRDAGGRFDHRLHLLAPVVVRDAEHRGVADRGVRQQGGLDLGRVDVHAARHDHVDLAVAQVEEAVVVELTHVADGEVVAVAVGRGLLGIALVRELAHELEVDGADGAGRDLVAVVVEHLHVGADPRPTRPCPGAPASPRAWPACRRPPTRRRTRRSPGRATRTAAA